MKIALVHDALVNKGGAERVFQVFCEIFPDASIFTTIFFPEKTYPFFKDKNINTTFLQNIVSSDKGLKLLFPIANILMGTFDLSDFDIVLSSSTFSGKYVNKKNAKHICYCYTPFRFLWSPESYAVTVYSKKFLTGLDPFLYPLRKWDHYVAQKVDQFVAMTERTRQRILKNYGRDSIVLHPPINCERYFASNETSDFFLLVSRLEPYKKVDLVVESFNRLHIPLKIVGTGSLFDFLRKKASSNIEFLGAIDDQKLLNLYQRCIGVIFPQEEDYGLVPLEANASGKPVICYGQGGVETTMVPFRKDNAHNATAIFFMEQSVDALITAVKDFDKINFRTSTLIANAVRFDIKAFRQGIINTVERL